MHRRTKPTTWRRSKALRQELTEPEARLWGLLRGHRLGGIHFRRQHGIGDYIMDFCAPREHLVIVLDGSQHLDQEAYDQKRSLFLQSRGYQVLRFWNSEIMNHPERVLEVILRELGYLEE